MTARPSSFFVTCFLSLLIAFSSSGPQAQTTPEPDGHSLRVLNGSSDDTYAQGTEIEIEADDKSEDGFIFLGWFMTQNGGGSLLDPFSAKTTFTMGGHTTELAAVYARADIHFDHQTLAHDPERENGLSLPKPTEPDTDPLRLPAQYVIEIFLGEANGTSCEGDTLQDHVKHRLSIAHSWFPLDVAEGVYHSDHVKWFREEEGGEPMRKDSSLKGQDMQEASQPDPETAFYTIPLYYESHWEPKTDEESGDPVPAPSFGVQGKLSFRKVAGNWITFGKRALGDLRPVEVVPDYNRDGMINDEDSGKATDEEPFVFWINDDDDENEEPHYGDVPGQGVDNADNVVNGERDLVDFFPVQLRIKAMLDVLPEDEYTYKISHPTGAFHFIEMPDVHADSSPEAQGAGSYLRNQTMADDAMARPMKDTAGDGAELSIEYLAAVKNDMGVLLFESTSATNQSFELIVTKNGGGEVARITRALPVEIADVEEMFWRSNIRPAAKGQTPEAVEEPSSEKFKASRKDQWFVFCHGYNVSKEAARGWNAEVFKRLHQQGSDARFVGVTWDGNQGQFDASLAFKKMLTPDYWRNVYNAFSSSNALAAQINGLTGSSKSKTLIAAHSLGNMLVSSAICDHGLQAGQYFMFNSAVPREAYKANYAQLDQANMRNPRWQNYPNRLWSTHWKDVYAATDGRNKLTWQDRFDSLQDKTTSFNYYSTGEDVAKPPTEGQEPLDIGIAVVVPSAWVSQEMNKGLAVKAVLNGLPTGNWSAGGGWAFNINHYSEYRPNPLDPGGGNPLPDTSPITEGQLRENPFFKPFTKLELLNGGASPAADGTDITTPAGAAHAEKYVIRAWMLAHEIPSLSLPTASGKLDEVGGAGVLGNDMETDFKTGNWGVGAKSKWTHSAMKERDPLQVWKLYKSMCDKGDLRKP